VEKITVIGAGNMGSALIRGFLASGMATSEDMLFFDVDPLKVRTLEEELGIQSAGDLRDALTSDTTVLLLAVKPQIIGDVLDSLADKIDDRLLVVSIAAGISTKFILSRIQGPARVIRAMPNAAAMLGCSATALCGAGIADESDAERAVQLFSAVGTAVLVNEKMINTVTALASSGLGYLFVMMEALTDAGVRLGLDRATARELTVRTFGGAAAMAASGGVPFSELKDRITSPGGTTIAGLQVLERSGLRGILMDVVEAAARRADELASG